MEKVMVTMTGSELQYMLSFFIVGLLFMICVIAIMYCHYSCKINSLNDDIKDNLNIMNNYKDILEDEEKHLDLLKQYAYLSIFLRDKKECIQQLEYIEGYMGLTNIDVSESLLRESISSINKYLLSLESDECELLDGLKFIDNYFGIYK